MTATTSKLGAEMTDEQIAHFGHTYSEEHDEPLFTFDRTGFIACVRALLARQPAAIDKGEAVYVPVEPTEAMIRAACLNQSKAQFSSYEEWLDSHSSGVSERIRDLVSGDYRAMIAAARAAPTSANVAQTVSEKCARLAELYRDEHAMSGQEEEICNAIAEACRDYGSANVAQGAEAIYQAKIIVDPKWTDVTKSEFDNYVELGGFDTRVVYAAPPAQTATTVTPAMVKAAIPWLTGLHHMRNTDAKAHIEEAIKAALTAAQSASGDTK